MVVTAHGIGAPRLLLYSAREGAENVAANSTDQVGGNLMDHSSKPSWAKTPEPAWPFRGPASTSVIENLRDGVFCKDRAAFRSKLPMTAIAGPRCPLSTAADLAKTGLRGAELDAAIKEATSHEIRINSLVEHSPEAADRVALDPDRRDANGMPLPRNHFDCSDHTRAGLDAAEQAQDEVIGATGAPISIMSPDIQGTDHIIGAVRMGADGKSVVVDANLCSPDNRYFFPVGFGSLPNHGHGQPKPHHCCQRHRQE